MADKQKEVKIETTSEASKGNYTNAVKVAVTNSEAIVDFAFLYPDDVVVNKGVIVSRLIMNHDLATKLAKSITETLTKHGKKSK